MTGYVCIAMLVDPPYNIFLSLADGKPEDWLAKLPMPSHLLCYDHFDDAEKVEQQCLTKLKEKGIDARSYRAFSADPHEVIYTFMSIRNNSVKDSLHDVEVLNQESDKEEKIPVNDIKINNKNGPFGLNMGMTLEQINNEYELLGNGIFRLHSVPKPHSEFIDYIVRVSPRYGLYWIKAIGKTISTSSHGIDLEIAFDKMAQKLKVSYGEVATKNNLLPGSIWSAPNDFMMGLVQKERSLYILWSDKDLTNKNDLISVYLGANALDGNSGYITLEYSFNNEALGEADLSQMEDDVL